MGGRVTSESRHWEYKNRGNRYPEHKLVVVLGGATIGNGRELGVVEGWWTGGYDSHSLATNVSLVALIGLLSATPVLFPQDFASRMKDGEKTANQYCFIIRFPYGAGVLMDYLHRESLGSLVLWCCECQLVSHSWLLIGLRGTQRWHRGTFTLCSEERGFHH